MTITKDHCYSGRETFQSNYFCACFAHDIDFGTGGFFLGMDMSSILMTSSCAAFCVTAMLLGFALIGVSSAQLRQLGEKCGGITFLEWVQIFIAALFFIMAAIFVHSYGC